MGPVTCSGGFEAALRAFVEASVEAYTLGHSADALRAEARAALAEGPLRDADDDEFGVWLTLAFLALREGPGAVRRWAPPPAAPAVSAEAELAWLGVVRLALSWYYQLGYSSGDTTALAAAQRAAQGRADLPHIVAERMRLIFAVVSYVSPMYPDARL